MTAKLRNVLRPGQFGFEFVCPMAALLLWLGLPAGPVDAEPGTAHVRAALPEGDFVIVGARRSSAVAGYPVFEPMPIGSRVTIRDGQLELADLACEDWRFVPLESPALYPEADPVLTDLVLPPTESPASCGDQRAGSSYRLECEGEGLVSIYQVDDRVLVVPWKNHRINLILEKPLSPDQVMRYQRQLKMMKFYQGEVHGRLDEETLFGSRLWYEYRASLAGDAPIPGRPAITENLLDTLGVLAPSGCAMD